MLKLKRPNIVDRFALLLLALNTKLELEAVIACVLSFPFYKESMALMAYIKTHLTHKFIGLFN